jgi:hypothetical protein
MQLIHLSWLIQVLNQGLKKIKSLVSIVEQMAVDQGERLSKYDRLSSQRKKIRSKSSSG